MSDIFFSYKQEDRARVVPLVHLLEHEGFTVWWDPELVAGERFSDVIDEEIGQAHCVIVAWSARAIHAEWVCDEASTGRDRHILVPISLDGARPPMGFRQYQTPDLSDWTSDADDPRIRQLVDGVRRVVEGEEAHPPHHEPLPDHDVLSPDEVEKRPRPTISRRRLLLQVGVGAAVVAGGGGIWFGASTLWRRSLPDVTIDDFALVTVDGRGALQPQQARSVEVFDVPVGSEKMSFSVIPAGQFQVGSPDTEPERQLNEGPQKSITLKKFALGRTTVTQGQWAALLGLAPTPIEQSLAVRPATFLGDDDLPVESIGWRAANEFCARLSKLTGLPMRLPSETEWEYACRAGSNTPFHFGPTLTPDLANYCGTGGAVRGMNGSVEVTSDYYRSYRYRSGAYGDGPVGIFNGKTVPVRTYPPNAFGLYEMHGNVWEHCADAGPLTYQQVPEDGSSVFGAQGEHVLRGGSWSHNPAMCRSAYRDGMSIDTSGWAGRVGMRVVCELDSTT